MCQTTHRPPVNCDLAAVPAAQRAGISLNSTPPLAFAFFAVSTSDTVTCSGVVPAFFTTAAVMSFTRPRYRARIICKLRGRHNTEPTMKRFAFAIGLLALGLAAATPARADYAVVRF